MYITICASNRGKVRGVPSHFGRGGTVVFIVTVAVVVGSMAEVGVSEVAPSLRHSVGGTGA